MTNGNDSAYARPASEFTANGTLSDGNDAIKETNGLTKREYFAGLAMQGLLATGQFSEESGLGGGSYHKGDPHKLVVGFADALILALNKDAH